MPTEVVNLTQFPHFKFSNSDNRGLEFGVLMLKASFDIGEDGICKIADEQEASNFKDITHGEINKSSLRQPSELVGYKPVADIIVNAMAHAPGGQPAPSWNTGVQVSDANGIQATKILRVTGPRFWVPQWQRDLSDEEKRDWCAHRNLFRGWHLSEPEPIRSLPVRYEHAYGGTVRTGPDENGKPTENLFQYNPFGRGMIDAEWTDHTKPVPAPQIEFASDPISEAGKDHYPASFGPIPPVWLPRRPLGGTFDKKWMDEIWPKWPPDYDFAYNNSASASLTAKGFLEGDIKIHLLNLHPEKEHWKLTIPNPKPFVMAVTEEEEQLFFHPALDTVFLDIEAPDAFEQRLSLVWRLVFPKKTTGALFIDKPDENDARAILTNGTICPALHPNTCAARGSALERPA